MKVGSMFVVWAYLWVVYWDHCGSCAIIEAMLRHFIAYCPMRDRLRDTPAQKESTYG